MRCSSRRSSFDTLSADEVSGDLEPLRRSRLLNPSELRSRFRVDRGEVAGLTIDDLDVDRYELDGDMEQVLIAARELDLDGIANQSWQGRHLINTRGCGLVMAPVSHVLENGRPDYRTVEIERPELYFSPSLTGYAVAGTNENERECGDNAAYTGTPRRADVVLRPPGRVRPRVPRLQRARLGRDRRQLPDAVGPRCPRPGGEVGAVPLLRRRSVPGRRPTAASCG